MSNRNEISSLYRTFSPTFNAYTRDGDGRDGYIGYNNGGFWNTRIPPGTSFESTFPESTRYRLRSINRQVAPFKYYSDGSGRDSYILINSGGLKRESKAMANYHLKDFLRTPDQCVLEFHKPSAGHRHYVSRDEYRINQILKKKERGIIDRLYIKEKHKFLPSTSNSSRNKNEKNKRNLPSITTSLSKDFIYDVDKINRYERVKVFNKLSSPTNSYLHFNNDIVK